MNRLEDIPILDRVALDLLEENRVTVAVVHYAYLGFYPRLDKWFTDD